MASFNDLPVELITKIIELSIEDSTVLQQSRVTSKILFKLSLLARPFTLPAGIALWREISAEDIINPNFLRVIGAGLGRNRRVESLVLGLNREEGEAEFSRLKEVLEGISSVRELFIYDESRTVAQWYSLFEVSSLKSKSTGPTFRLEHIELSSIDLHKLTLENIPLNDYAGSLTTNLQNLTFHDALSAESLLAQPLISSLPIDTISFNFHNGTEDRNGLMNTSLSYFHSHGHALKSLTFESFDSTKILLFLTYTPSLIHLSLIFHELESFSTIEFVQVLPLTTRLVELSISRPDMDNCTSLHILLPLQILPQLAQLKVLRYYNDSWPYGERYEEGSLEELDDGDIIKIGLDHSVGVCQGQGIRLSFYSEEMEYQVVKRRSHKLYERRQKELDRI